MRVFVLLQLVIFVVELPHCIVGAVSVANKVHDFELPGAGDGVDRKGLRYAYVGGVWRGDCSPLWGLGLGGKDI